MTAQALVRPPAPLEDPAEVVRAAGLYVDFDARQVTEIRAIDAVGRGERFVTTWAGWFNNAEAIAESLKQLSAAGGIFLIPNAIDPDLLARRVNRIGAVRGKSTPLTADKDVIRRRWLLVDADAVRPTGISATDTEHEAALAVAAEIRDCLREEDWPLPLYVDSGNGGHVDFRIDEPAEDGGLIETVLAKLQERFGRTGVKIDGTAANPARPWKLPGTRACKGDDAGVIGRPHRPSSVLDVPEVLEVVPHEMLVRLADHRPRTISVPAPPTPTPFKSCGSLDIDRWVAEHEPGARGPETFLPNSGGTGRKWVLPVCPFNPSHTNDSAAIFEFGSGAVGFTCLHDSCRGHSWQDLRKLREPNYEPTSAAPPAPPDPAAGGSLPTPVTVRDLICLYPRLRPPRIHGLLREGETMNVIAPPKTGKSWLTIDLALAVATGRSWLGQLQTVASEVLIVDNELHGETSAHRIPIVADARAITLDEYADRVSVQNLRGKLTDLLRLGPYFAGLRPGRFGVIILDAFYRFLPSGSDENDNGAMAGLYNYIDSYAQMLGCCFVLIHHSSKGNQSGKSVTDVGAGAGAQSRATDSHLVLRPHEEDGAVVMDAAVRSWQPPAPMVLRWNFPVWTPDPSLDPSMLRQEGRARKRKEEDPPEVAKQDWTPQAFVDRFVTKQGATKDLILVNAESAGVSTKKAERLLGAAVDSGLAFKWQRGRAVKDLFSTENAPQMFAHTNSERKLCRRKKKH